MSDLFLSRGGRFGARPVNGAPAAGPGAASGRLRCRLAKCKESEIGFTDEMTCLLRTRLRFAILLVLAVFVLHFLRHLFLPDATVNRNRPLLSCH
jgi:hypothetical protein